MTANTKTLEDRVSEMQQALQDNGFESKAEYFESLADDYDVELSAVEFMADILGDNEL